MNDQQRSSAAKFLYDITKGLLLVIVVGNLMQEQTKQMSVILGLAASVVTYWSAYQLEK